MADRAPFPFLHPTPPQVPAGLIAMAKAGPVPRVALVGADAVNPLAGIREAADNGLAEPILIGDPDKIRATAEEIGWDIDGLRIVAADHHGGPAEAARLARDGEADSIMKGQIHTSDFLSGLLPTSAGLREKGARCGHIFHITAPGRDRALLITDAALNIAPDLETRKHCLALAVDLALKLGVDRPRAAILSPNEVPMDGIPNTMEAAEIAAWADEALPHADVAGPLALDLVFSAEAAAAKGLTTPVAGDADILLVPEITSGNAIFKLMVFGMGCCAGGLVLGAKVPILLT
ncbi:MAG: phosphate acyltransferase, partial [Pseudomonadota bacterium]